MSTSLPQAAAELRAREVALLARVEAGDASDAAELLTVQQARLQAIRRERAGVSVWGGPVLPLALVLMGCVSAGDGDDKAGPAEGGQR